jgi:hypothetical protein
MLYAFVALGTAAALGLGLLWFERNVRPFSPAHPVIAPAPSRDGVTPTVAPVNTAAEPVAPVEEPASVPSSPTTPVEPQPPQAMGGDGGEGASVDAGMNVPGLGEDPADGAAVGAGDAAGTADAETADAETVHADEAHAGTADADAADAAEAHADAADADAAHADTAHADAAHANTADAEDLTEAPHAGAREIALPSGAVKTVRFSEHGDTLDIDLELSGPFAVSRAFSLRNPARIVLDVAGAVPSESGVLEAGDGVERIEVLAQSGDRTRLRLLLTRPVERIQAGESGVVAYLEPKTVAQ